MSEKHGNLLPEYINQYNVSKKSIEKGKQLVTYLNQNMQGQHPELVLDFGIEVTQNNSGYLSDITFMSFVEEFFMAALELKQLDWAQVFLKAICLQFPDNVKTMRLLAMFYEAQNNTFKAQELYLEIIEKTPEDSQTMKRLISLYKNNDMPNDAIAMLNKYLEVN